ncbi:MAG: hypothetical protein FJ224_07865 [Lentisphaerae bacterium]|nr:hypothetical protein [Lentisphaerota bacterium]
MTHPPRKHVREFVLRIAASLLVLVPLLGEAPAIAAEDATVDPGKAGFRMNWSVGSGYSGVVVGGDYIGTPTDFLVGGSVGRGRFAVGGLFSFFAPLDALWGSETSVHDLQVGAAYAPSRYHLGLGWRGAGIRWREKGNEAAPETDKEYSYSGPELVFGLAETLASTEKGNDVGAVRLNLSVALRIMPYVLYEVADHQGPKPLANNLSGRTSAFSAEALFSLDLSQLGVPRTGSTPLFAGVGTRLMSVTGDGGLPPTFMGALFLQVGFAKTAGDDL